MLGADVPFLATEYAYALAWGRGERLLPLVPPPAADVMLVVPPFAVNTASAYRWLDDARAAGEDDSDGTVLLDLNALSRWDTLRPLAVNDFEPVVAARYPEIDLVLDELRRSGMDPVMMSGSGSTVFGIAPRQGALGRVPLRGATVHLTRTVVHVEPVLPID
jgi:4-diphosphocytidyl-2-C-methyl-D-erythritol kinase